MRVPLLKRLLWTLNALLAAAVILLAAWVALKQDFHPQASGRNDLPDNTFGGDAAAPAPRTKPLSLEDLEKVFSRTFAPPAAPGHSPSTLSTGLEAPEAVPSPGPSQVSKSPPPPASPPLTSLIRVVAIFHDQDPFLSAAVIENLRAGNQQELYWYPDKLKSIDAKILQIEEESVSFLHEGKEVVIGRSGSDGKSATSPSSRSAAPAPPPPPPKGAGAAEPVDPLNHHVVPRQEVLEALAKPIEAMRGMRYTLVDQNGEVVGFRLSGIDEKSIAGRHGIKENDVLCEVNGKRVDSNFNPFVAVTELMSSPLIRIKVKRDNQEIQLTYELK